MMKIDVSFLKALATYETLIYAAVVVLILLLSKFFVGQAKNFVDFFSDKNLQVDPYMNGVTYPVSYWTEVGGRPYQEDRFYVMKSPNTPDTSLYGVFDGHGGYKAAQYCKEYLLQCIAADPELEASPSRAISKSFKKYLTILFDFLFILSLLCPIGLTMSSRGKPERRCLVMVLQQSLLLYIMGKYMSETV